VAHSCLPNVGYSSKTASGVLEYRACRSIRAGDHICFSYIDAIWTKSTIERRRDCNETKDFSCRCVRCVGPDTTRVFRCPREGCDGFATPEVHPAIEGSCVDAMCWVCATCGPLDPSTTHEAMAARVKMERGLFRQLSALQAQAHTGGSSSISPGDVRAIADDASRVLSPTHWIVALAYILLQMICVSHATACATATTRHSHSNRHRGARHEPHGSEGSLHEQAAEAGGIHVRVCECIAEGCIGGKGCKRQHAAVHECGAYAFRTARELLQLQPHRRDPSLCALCDRYLPHMEIMCGKGSGDVEQIREMIAHRLAHRLGPDPSPRQGGAHDAAGDATQAPASAPMTPRSEAEVAAEWGAGAVVGAQAPRAAPTPRSDWPKDGGKKKGKKKS